MRKLVHGAAPLTAPLLAAALVAALPAPAAAVPDPAGTVGIEDIRRHLEAFQEIAAYNGGDRAAGRPGYDVSVKYVVSQLKRAGFTPRVQPFQFDYWEERTPAAFARTAPAPPATYRPGTDFQTMRYSGTGDVTAAAAAVDVPAAGAGTAGCEAADFAGFPAGSVALIQRGTCSFETKAANAQAARAAAVVIYNLPGEPGQVNGTLGRPFTIPAVETPHALGAELVRAARAGGLRLRIRTDTAAGKRSASNVIADTVHGRDDNVVVVGAHLDSVREGPGINDNGSGAATILAVAQWIQRPGRQAPRNKVRFAWWGAEEEGLVGSEHYVASLSAADRAKLALNLNFDMLGSPNGIRGVYDGDGSLGTGTTPPAGSGAIEKIFKDHYAARGLPTLESEFNGRSDYGPFIEHGIPAGGLFSGAEVVKTPRQAALFGGTAGRPYDPCYHKACDTTANIDWRLLDTHAGGVAAATWRLAASTLPVNGEARRAVRPGAALPRAAVPAAEWRGGHRVR
ncbi:aminopeptidase PaaP [Actinomadura viridis]|uniref:Zn-dependent M28 family amino/carboxypeptidase n=1 Tax=Actinomadura viridis TaxID=58110 RepID=A0A931GP12_9ACTN|nr:M28 family peptidase [Actinomadura viridis]MBG6086944.1 Zn-dependent M28 family amino/carboxypeptidase [Actinomadura viridis]